MLYIDTKYTKLVGLSIERFKIRKNIPFLAVGRCPICGDSKKSKTKTRLYFYEKSDKVIVTCHNCSWSGSILKFLKEISAELYKQYVFEKYTSAENSNPIIFNDAEEEKEKPNELIESNDFASNPELIQLSKLPTDNKARQYVRERKIPAFASIFYTQNFFKFASRYNDDFKNKPIDHARVIIPFYNSNGDVYAFQARALNGEQPKYYTIVLSPEEKRFGYYKTKVNATKQVFVVEGPIDSLFIPNCIAACSSSLSKTADEYIKNGCEKKNFVLVYDNEPRNKEIVKLIDKSISEGYNVVIWPERYNHKDVNDAIVGGVEPIDLYKIIKENIFSGIEAKIKFNNWKKC